MILYFARLILITFFLFGQKLHSTESQATAENFHEFAEKILSIECLADPDKVHQEFDQLGDHLSHVADPVTEVISIFQGVKEAIDFRYGLGQELTTENFKTAIDNSLLYPGVTRLDTFQVTPPESPFFFSCPNCFQTCSRAPTLFPRCPACNMDLSRFISFSKINLTQRSHISFSEQSLIGMLEVAIATLMGGLTSISPIIPGIFIADGIRRIVMNDWSVGEELHEEEANPFSEGA